MKQGAFVESAAGVLEKVGGGDRGAGMVQFEADDAKRGV